jgi:hypothetical protein
MLIEANRIAGLALRLASHQSDRIDAPGRFVEGRRGRHPGSRLVAEDSFL